MVSIVQAKKERQVVASSKNHAPTHIRLTHYPNAGELIASNYIAVSGQVHYPD